ncbi:Ig domain-containing protein [Demequina muriae]|uniref:Ig domain-containing protein n=1 Tax=Demequina muriae TaxID=3051664 RepID=A0ABT8GEC5_9MICO|nr:putative Ig domain-containing protein [Demequina sp. EGI L300058]MDN4479774.1 putative Ig domain-containing protein [Demequina sp. EGI L300058]
MTSTPRALSSLLTAGLAALALVALAPAAHAASESITDDLTGSPLQIDSDTAWRTFDVTTAGRVENVVVTLDFHKTDGQCSAPATGSAFSNEISIGLTSPGGTGISLVRPWDGVETGTGQYPDYSSSPGRVVIVLDDSAATMVGSTNAGVPESGTFRPAQPLSTFDGDSTLGTWTLRVQDTTGGDPLCYYSATLDLEIAPAPVLADALFDDMLLGEASSASIPLEPLSPAADSFAITEGALPAGVELNQTTGEISGTPTERGDFAFTAIATNEEGDSVPVEYKVRVTESATLSGDATAQARAGVDFTYTPSFDAGFPAATEVTLAAGDLPDGMALDGATGEITGASTGAVGDFAVTLAADNGVGEPATLDLVITVTAGPVVEIDIAAGETTVDEGGSLDFVVTGADEFGNPVVLTEDEAVLSSDVESDVVDGHTVSFPTASPHVITATHLETGVTASVTVEVIAAPVVETADDNGPEEVLADTGMRPEHAAQAAAASALLLLGTGLVTAAARRRV